MCLCVFAFVSVCLHAFAYIRVHLHVSACIYVCPRAYFCVRVWVRLCAIAVFLFCLHPRAFLCACLRLRALSCQKILDRRILFINVRPSFARSLCCPYAKSRMLSTCPQHTHVLCMQPIHGFIGVRRGVSKGVEDGCRLPALWVGYP
jgi:hypothetical protein